MARFLMEAGHFFSSETGFIDNPATEPNDGPMGESKTAESVQSGKREWRLPIAGIWIAAAIALVARLLLLPYVSEDSSIYLLPWMHEFREHGPAALGGEFSNYNFPYLFLMYLASLLPIEPLIAIKIVSLAGDCLLALSMAGLVAQFRSTNISPAVAAVITLFTPTVLLNASMWGQCDSIYTSFLLLSLRSLLHGNGRNAWILWGVALSFKLQSVFFLPALMLISLRNRYSPTLPVMSASVWAALTLPPVLFGRSIESTFSIYANQTQEYLLVAGAANIYTWLPTVTAEQGKVPALLLCGLALLFVSVAYWRGSDSAERKVLLAVTAVAVCPLLLPQMHERYFFAAEVMALLFLRHRHLFLIPWLFAATGTFVYFLYFQSNQYALPLMLASIVQCVGVGILTQALWRRHDPVTKTTQPLSNTTR